MSNRYKLRIEASKPKTPEETLIQAELDEFFDSIDKRFDVSTEIVNDKEYIYWTGEVDCGFSDKALQQYHEKIKKSLQEQTEDYSANLKVKTSWLDLERFDESIGDEKI